MDETKEKELDVIEGSVSAIVYQNRENGYTVLRLKTLDMGEITAVGTIPLSTLGERLRITGQWVMHQSYGRQMQAEFVERQLPDTADDILSYLSSGAVKGVGPKTAQRLVSAFGDKTLRIMEDQPELLSTVEGISQKKAREIGEAFQKQVGIRILMEYLQEYGLPVRLAMRLYTAFGQTALTIVKANPYILTDDYFAADFELVDRFALEIGTEEDSELRMAAGIQYELHYNQNNGHTFLPRAKLISATAALLSLSTDAVELITDKLLENGKLFTEAIGNAEAIYNASMYDAETFVADRLKYLSGFQGDADFNVQAAIDKIQRIRGVEYAEKQRRAMAMAVENRVLLLTGGPGTGKTTTVRGIIDLFDRLELKTVLAAPTGRAAKRMSELCDREAMTIHRLLEAQFTGEGGGMSFYHDESEPIDADAVIVDETSMVDITLARALLCALRPECRVVFVGDPNQLPSVGPGNFLSDMIRSQVIPCISLTEIFRQAEKSLIILNAHKINNGEMPELTAKDKDFFFMKRRSSDALVSTIVELCQQRLPKNMGIESNQIQVLSPTRIGEAGTVSLNKQLQQVLNPPAVNKLEKAYGSYTFRQGDRVMQIKNNYDIIWTRGSETGSGMFNGDIGVIEAISLTDEFMYINFDDRKAVYSFDMLSELELAYAMTVHKSQGSEYRAVILSVFSVPTMLKARNLLYTAVTRAKELLIVVGDEEILHQMVENDKQRKRYSGLKVRLTR